MRLVRNTARSLLVHGVVRCPTPRAKNVKSFLERAMHRWRVAKQHHSLPVMDRVLSSVFINRRQDYRAKRLDELAAVVARRLPNRLGDNSSMTSLSLKYDFTTHHRGGEGEG